jgi:hypothetical protein
MADFSIKVDPSLERYVAKLLQMPTYKPVVDRLVEEATKRRDEAIERWPVARRFRDGQPTRKQHSRDQFSEIIVEVQPSRIVVKFENRAPYVYYVRSHLTGISQKEQQELRRLRQGEDLLDVTLRVRDREAKKSAMTWLIRRPVKKTKAALVAELGADLARIANGS